MDISFQLLAGTGLALCALAGGQLALWTSGRIRVSRVERRRFALQQQALRQEFSNVARSNLKSSNEEFHAGQTWRGYRHFVVQRLVKETATTTSVYLVPADGKPIASFKPGQHLTLRFSIPGQSKPIVRCYSLSESPNKPYYRISVKEVPPPANQPELGVGKVSHYINRIVEEGQIVEVKSPGGEFYLNEQSNRLVVLLAGGVGITPMISMLNRLIDLKSERTVLLVNGVRHGQDHPFKNYLRETSQVHENIHLVNCYSQPQPTDQIGVDYHAQGNVGMELLKKILQHPDAEFYLCGPPLLMKSLYVGLLEWGASPTDVRFEAFCPASIATPLTLNTSSPSTEPLATHPVMFGRSELTIHWDGKQTLLELAESQRVSVDSGCRAGSCGTCCVPLINGQVEYPAGQKPDCPAGHCLMCIAKPRGAVELDV